MKKRITFLCVILLVAISGFAVYYNFTNKTSPCGPEHGYYVDDNGNMICGDTCEGDCCKNTVPSCCQ